ncbi:hypothetical protein EVAR_13249_1 [Eumeta japonica]|uniref:Uncharacterized protein n=1 Tax=Eumeta variegata TaxID=151549 RepID=A0A4C1TSA9_EUMVA|nr:hypothetical protein EVAR_13249_1 [Eumeta japonica]
MPCRSNGPNPCRCPVTSEHAETIPLRNGHVTRRWHPHLLSGCVQWSCHRIPANSSLVADPPFLQKDFFSAFQPHSTRVYGRAGVRIAFFTSSSAQEGKRKIE